MWFAFVLALVFGMASLWCFTNERMGLGLGTLFGIAALLNGIVFFVTAA